MQYYQNESQGAKQSTDLQVFNSPDFGEIRTTLSPSNEPLFCLADVCKILELQTNKVKKRLDHRGWSIIPSPTYNQYGTLVMQQLNFISEPNLYKCIFQSRKKEAEQFQDWVCTEVLPAIRKQGGYIAVGKNDDEFTILSKAVLIANSQIEKLKNQNTVLQEKINTDAPKVLFADAVATSDKSILIGELAKIITQNGVNIGQKRLFEWMRENGYLCSRGEMYNIPTQYAMNLGLFEIKKVAIQKPNGASIVNTTPKVTVKGQIYFLDKYLSLHRDLLKNY